MLDPRRLLTFGEVARRGSFSRAAEALALTQPAVSQQVAALERQLGVRLLDRGPGGPSVTEAGALLLAHADAVADRLGPGRRPGRRARGRGSRDAAARRVPERARLDRPPRDQAPARRAARPAVRRRRGIGARVRRRRRRGRAAPRRLLPGRDRAAARARGDRAARVRRGADARRPRARPSAGGPRLDPAGGARGRDLDGAVARAPDPPHVRAPRASSRTSPT